MNLSPRLSAPLVLLLRRVGAGLAVVTVALFASCSAAVAQTAGNPLLPGLPQSPATVPTATTPTVAPTVSTTSTSAGGLSGTDAVAIAIGALVVLGGISFFIWRDARRRAPVRHRAAEATVLGGGRAGTKARAKPRKPSPAERRRRKRGRAR